MTVVTELDDGVVACGCCSRCRGGSAQQPQPGRRGQRRRLARDNGGSWVSAGARARVGHVSTRQAEPGNEFVMARILADETVKNHSFKHNNYIYAAEILYQPTHAKP